VLLEYTAHPEACFHLSDGRIIPVLSLTERTQATDAFQPVKPATQRIKLRVIEQEGGKSVPVKLHMHGELDEYLAPVDRHRIPNSAWFEDYSVDFVHGGGWDGRGTNPHYCTYIPGDTTVDLPLGKVYIEIRRLKYDLCVD
jgi:hypothetical protein